MTFPISLVLPELPPIKIVDVGAMSWGADPYERLAAALDCQIVGFEPLEEECRKRNAAARPGQTYLPYFIGDGSAQTFHECAAPYTSSLLEPDLAFLERFTGFAELHRVVRKTAVQTRRLDDIAEAAGADFLKLDVQGAELMVLDGAERLLRSVLVICTEAEFMPLYRSQPLFADIDARLRASGFMLHRLPFIGVRPFQPFPEDASRGASQHLWCDLVYVRDIRALERLRDEELLKLAAVLHENFRSYDLASMLLREHDLRSGADLQQQYLSYLLAG